MILQLFLIFAICLCPSAGVYKRWVPNTDFTNPVNWDVGRVPCQSDTIIFPESAPLIYMQTNATYMDIVLPSNGEIILGDYMTLSFDSDSRTSVSGDCRGQQVRYNRTDPEVWLDADNWCVTQHPDDTCSLRSNPVLLDTERLPCQYDDVIFPRGSGFKVSLPTSLLFTMKSLTLNGNGFTTSTFSSYLDSAQGRKQFVRAAGASPTRFAIKGETCSDVTGCACGNDREDISKAVCNIRASQCGPPACQEAIRPVGHCCDICGARVELDYGAGFRLERIRNMLRDDIIAQKPGYKDVKMIMSKLSSGKIQVVLLDQGDGSAAVDAGQTFTRTIQTDISGARIYAVTTITMEVSKALNTPSTGGQTGQPESVNGATIAGIIIACAIVILLVAILLLFIMRRRNGDIFFKFQRFMQKKDMPIEMSSDFSGVSVPGGGFDNPIYGTHGPVKDLSPQKLEKSLKQNGNDTLQGFDNPMYSFPQRLSNKFYADPTKADPGTHFNPVYSTEGIDDDSKF